MIEKVVHPYVKYIGGIILAVSSMVFGVSQQVQAKPISIPADIRPKLVQALAAAYGNQWDKKNECMRYEGDDAAYCMSIHALSLKQLADKQYYYLTVAGDAYDQDGQFEMVGHAQSGLVGLFLFEKIDQQWQLSASAKALSSGQWGRSQAEQYKVEQIGPHQWSWVATEAGSGAGGETSASWLMFMKSAKSIKQIASIEVEHQYLGSFSLDKKVSVQILRQQQGYAVYPLQLKLSLSTGPVDATGEPVVAKQRLKQREKVVYFNEKRQFFIDPFSD